MKEVLRVQYEFVTQSRTVLMDFCAKLTTTDLVCENSSFGKGSIRNLLTHIGNTYLFWIGEIGMGRKMEYSNEGSIPDIVGLVAHFKKVDVLMNEFFEIEFDATKEVDYQINGQSGRATLLKIATHVMTHEFHHKGQILSLSRHLGHIPVDTDIMR
jgi:uncharacterized damage-inducible protein DinB